MQSTIKVFAVGYLSNKLKHVHARLSEKDLAMRFQAIVVSRVS